MATARRSALTYTLTLSEAEAVVLRDVMRSIAGPTSGPRGCCDSINQALGTARVPIQAQSTAYARSSIQYLGTTTVLP